MPSLKSSNKDQTISIGEKAPSIGMQSIGYSLLKLLSHSRYLKTRENISLGAKGDVYEENGLIFFDKHMRTYLDYRDRSVIDVGCGTGNLCIYLAKSGARRVTGIDIDGERIQTARRKAAEQGVTDRVVFENVDFVKAYRPSELFEIAFSKGSFEHILSPLYCLQKIYDCLSPGGTLATIFGPLWLHPYGAHMRGFTPLPWVHFLIPERTVLQVRREFFRPDEIADKYEDIRGSLNRMTVGKFRQFAVQAGFQVQVLRVNPARDTGRYSVLNACVNAIPLLQELCALQLLAVLNK